MKHLLYAFALIALIVAPASAGTTIDDPVAFVRSVYQKLAAGQDYDPPPRIYTPRLAALFALDHKEANGQLGRIDFFYWVNGQDWTLKNVKVTRTPVQDAKGREIVVAEFTNIDSKERIEFYFENGPNGWKLDDARSTGADSWTLSLLLKYGRAAE